MLDPDDVAVAARRIAAKMIADQAVPLMLTMVGCSGDPENVTAEDLQRFYENDETHVVLVARGRGKRKLLDWLQRSTSSATFEVENTSDDHGDACNCEHCR